MKLNNKVSRTDHATTSGNCVRSNRPLSRNHRRIGRLLAPRRLHRIKRVGDMDVCGACYGIPAAFVIVAFYLGLREDGEV